MNSVYHIFVSVCICILPGINTSAVFLAVQVIFPGKFQTALESAFLLEIGIEPFWSGGISGCKFFSDCVYFQRILEWTYGKCCAEIIKMIFNCKVIGFLQPQIVASTASLAFFFFMGKLRVIFDFDCLVEFFRVVVQCNRVYFVFHGRSESWKKRF